MAGKEARSRGKDHLLAGVLWHVDVEVQDVFANAKLRVERDRRCVRRIGLHENDVRAALPRNLAQLFDQRGGEALPPVR